MEEQRHRTDHGATEQKEEKCEMPKAELWNNIDIDGQQGMPSKEECRGDGHRNKLSGRKNWTFGRGNFNRGRKDQGFGKVII